MPLYEYQATDPTEGCAHCSERFEYLQKLSDPPLKKCPQCGVSVSKLVSAHSVGASASGLDNRAKSAGFHKLKRLGKGEYERKY